MTSAKAISGMPREIHDAIHSTFAMCSTYANVHELVGYGDWHVGVSCLSHTHACCVMPLGICDET
jgi:hypothetical protein